MPLRRMCIVRARTNQAGRSSRKQIVPSVIMSNFNHMLFVFVTYRQVHVVTAGAENYEFYGCFEVVLGIMIHASEVRTYHVKARL